MHYLISNAQNEGPMLAKITFEFNLPNDADDYRTIMKAANYRTALSEVMALLRSKKKYADLPEDQHALLTELTEACWNIIDENEARDE